MIGKRWTSRSNALDRAPDQIGVYSLAWSGSIVYIGSGNIDDRLQAHTNDRISWNQARWKLTNRTDRARQKERKFLRQFKARHGQTPKYNDRIG